jgi:hypothetical protein
MDRRLLMLIAAVIIVAGVVWYLAPMQSTEPMAPEAPAATTPEATPEATPETPATTTP